MWGLLNNLRGSPDESPLGQAQQLMYKAFDATGRAERVRIARQALDISPDCADAYVLLAEETDNRKEALELFEKGVAAGERVLGPQVFQEEAGHFWGLFETRPYMRARKGLACALWTIGRRDEAIRHLQEMLRLNPGDNQGVRYTLAGWLLTEKKDGALAQLLHMFDEASADWVYNRVLLAFRRTGDTSETRRRLEAAKTANPYVMDYLLGQERLPPEPPGHYSPGDQSEAILYACRALRAWRETPGAVTWLRGVEHEQKRSRDPLPDPVGPLPSVKQRLRQLPQVFDVWQADHRPMPHWVKIAGEVVRPWIVMVTSRTNDLSLASKVLIDETQSPDLLWDQMAQAMEQPPVDEPHRPTELQILPHPRWDALKPHLEEIGITVVPVETLDHLEIVFEDLAEHIGGKSPPPLLEMPGIKPEQVAGFYRAAAGYHRRAPWRKLDDEQAIRVECDRYQSGPWYAVVMGQAGITFGLALYDDMETLRKLWASDLSDETPTRETVSLAVTFGPETEISVADLDATKRHGWELAGPEAYPSAFRKERGMSIRPPLAWELELLEGSLRAIPAFVSRHPPEDVSRHKMTVPVASGELILKLSWVGD